MGGSGSGGFRASEDGLYDFQGNALRAASDLQQVGLVSLMVIGQLAPGLASQTTGLDSLSTLQTDHQNALDAAMTTHLAAVNGIEFLGQGAGLIGSDYHATDLAGASGVKDLSVGTINALLSPAPAPKPGTKPPAPTDPQLQKELTDIGNSIAAQPGASGMPVMNPLDGSITVQVRAIPAMPTPPPIPGQPKSATPVLKGLPASTYRTAPEGQLPPDATVVDPNLPSQVEVTPVTFGLGGVSGGTVTILPGTRSIYDEDARRRNVPTAETLPTGDDGPTILAPGPLGQHPVTDSSGGSANAIAD